MPSGSDAKALLQLTQREKALAKKITEVYAVFGVCIGPLIEVVHGEGVIRFKFFVESETVFPKIIKFRDDVSLFLSVPRAQLICPIPGELAFSIEIADK